MVGGLDHAQRRPARQIDQARLDLPADVARQAQSTRRATAARARSSRRSADPAAPSRVAPDAARGPRRRRSRSRRPLDLRPPRALRRRPCVRTVLQQRADAAPACPPRRRTAGTRADRGGAADVVRYRRASAPGLESPDAQLRSTGRDHAVADVERLRRGTAGIHEHRRAARKPDERRIALPDIENVTCSRPSPRAASASTARPDPDCGEAGGQRRRGCATPDDRRPLRARARRRARAPGPARRSRRQSPDGDGGATRQATAGAQSTSDADVTRTDAPRRGNPADAHRQRTTTAG